MMSYSPNGVDPNSSYQGLSEDAERVFCRGWLQPAMSVALRYGLALILVSVALVLAQTFLYYGLPQPFTASVHPFTALALSAIAITFWYGGTKPGILAALISWLVRDYLFEPEISTESRLLYGLVFLVFALVMTLVKRGRNELEARVVGRTAELTKTNEDLTLEIARHKQTEEALRRSEANLAEAQRLSHTGSWALSPATRKIHYWSDECYRIWGFDPVQGLPNRETVWQRIHPGDRDRMYKETQEALRQKRDYTVECRIVLPDGTVKYLEAIGHYRFSARGELVEVVGTNVDVTERKRAEKALRESEAKNRRLVAANIIGIIIWDLEGRIIEANDAFLRMVGYDHEDLVSGRIRWTDLTPSEWLDRDERQWLPELKVTGSLQPFEKEYFRKDGSRVPVLMGAATFEEGGNQGVAFVLDLTQRKQDEEALRQSEDALRVSEAHLAEAQRLSHTGSFRYSLKTGNIIFSDEMFRILELDRAVKPRAQSFMERLHPDDRGVLGQAVAQLIMERVHPEDRDSVQQAASQFALTPLHDRLLGNGAPFQMDQSVDVVVQPGGKEYEHRLLMTDGSIKRISGIINIVDDPPGTLSLVGTIMDVTAMKRSEEELQQAREELARVARVTTLGELTAAIAHEVNQPLTGVVSSGNACLRWLANDQPDLNAARRAAERIVRDGSRAAEVISRVRALVKKSHQRADLLNLNEVVADVLSLVPAELQRNRIALRTSLADDLPLVVGDRIQLQQVILNLIMNAKEAMEGVIDGRRELLISSARDASSNALLTVSDSGPGFECEELEGIFEAFYTTKPEGMGIGLAVSRSIIEAHGGRVWAMPNKPRGAVLQFTLPACREESRATLPAVGLPQLVTSRPAP
jgi:PAS domain S-box-containing protein